MQQIDNCLSRLEPAREQFTSYRHYFRMRWETFAHTLGMLEAAGIKCNLEAGWHIPFAPWPRDPRKTFFQELREYRLPSWLGLLTAHSHDIVAVGRIRRLEHIIISRKTVT